MGKHHNRFFNNFLYGCCHWKYWNVYKKFKWLKSFKLFGFFFNLTSRMSVIFTLRHTQRMDFEQMLLRGEKVMVRFVWKSPSYSTKLVSCIEIELLANAQMVTNAMLRYIYIFCPTFRPGCTSRDRLWLTLSLKKITWQDTSLVGSSHIFQIELLKK